MSWQGITFAAEFPDDGIEEGEGDNWEVVRPSGMAAANVIADLLRSAGMVVQVPEADVEHSSWAFPSEYQGRYFWVQLTDMGDHMLLTTQGHSPLFKKLFNRRDFYAEFLELVRGLLINHPKFSSVEWEYTDRNGNSRPRG